MSKFMFQQLKISLLFDFSLILFVSLVKNPNRLNKIDIIKHVSSKDNKNFKKDYYLKKLALNSYKQETEIQKIGIAIASAHEILRWAERSLPNGKIIGKVTNANTLHYKTFKPQKGGLFCERIFGPMKDFECACGKLQKGGLSIFQKEAFSFVNHNKFLYYREKITFIENERFSIFDSTHKNKKTETFTKNNTRKYCEICDVEYTWTIFRRYQLGYIQLMLPVTHVWFVKGSKSILANLLGLKKKTLLSLAYNAETTVLETSQFLIQKQFQRERTPFDIFNSWGKFASKNNIGSLEKKINSIKETSETISIENQNHVPVAVTNNTFSLRNRSKRSSLWSNIHRVETNLKYSKEYFSRFQEVECSTSENIFLMNPYKNSAPKISQFVSLIQDFLFLCNIIRPKSLVEVRTKKTKLNFIGTNIGLNQAIKDCKERENNTHLSDFYKIKKLTKNNFFLMKKNKLVNILQFANKYIKNKRDFLKSLKWENTNFLFFRLGLPFNFGRYKKKTIFFSLKLNKNKNWKIFYNQVFETALEKFKTNIIFLEKINYSIDNYLKNVNSNIFISQNELFLKKMNSQSYIFRNNKLNELQGIYFYHIKNRINFILKLASNETNYMKKVISHNKSSTDISFFPKTFILQNQKRENFKELTILQKKANKYFIRFNIFTANSNKEFVLFEPQRWSISTRCKILRHEVLGLEPSVRKHECVFNLNSVKVRNKFLTLRSKISKGSKGEIRKDKPKAQISSFLLKNKNTIFNKNQKFIKQLNKIQNIIFYRGLNKPLKSMSNFKVIVSKNQTLFARLISVFYYLLIRFYITVKTVNPSIDWKYKLFRNARFQEVENSTLNLKMEENIDNSLNKSKQLNQFYYDEKNKNQELILVKGNRKLVYFNGKFINNFFWNKNYYGLNFKTGIQWLNKFQKQPVFINHEKTFLGYLMQREIKKKKSFFFTNLHIKNRQQKKYFRFFSKNYLNNISLSTFPYEPICYNTLKKEANLNEVKVENTNVYSNKREFQMKKSGNVLFLDLRKKEIYVKEKTSVKIQFKTNNKTDFYHFFSPYCKNGLIYKNNPIDKLPKEYSKIYLTNEETDKKIFFKKNFSLNIQSEYIEKPNLLRNCFNNFYPFSFLYGWEDLYSLQFILSFLSEIPKMNDIPLNDLYLENSKITSPNKLESIAFEIKNQKSFGNLLTDPIFSGAGIFKKILQTLSPKYCLLQTLIDLKYLYKKIATLKTKIRTIKMNKKLVKKIDKVQVNYLKFIEKKETTFFVLNSLYEQLIQQFSCSRNECFQSKFYLRPLVFEKSKTSNKNYGSYKKLRLESFEEKTWFTNFLITQQISQNLQNSFHINQEISKNSKEFIGNKIFNKFSTNKINQLPSGSFKDLFKELLADGLKNKKKLLELRPKLIRRIKLLRLFFKNNSSFDSLILKILPVLPADLRPIMKLDNQIAASDLNRLYQRIIYRNDRLKKFLTDSVTINSEVTRFAHRLLQEAVDNLIDNGKSGVQPETDSRGRALKSLTNLLKGKSGRFRQNLLGKRVDYSGRSVIVVGPKLKLHECGLPYEMAIELFLPFLLKRLLNYNLAQTVVGAKSIIRINSILIKELLREIMIVHPILLNRAPTLHRLGIQAFQPKLVDGKAILLHPLVCPAFNADFDGDQMAVHVPITIEARAEALKLMFARNNLLSSATGDPLVLPNQDMVLGCYYLTTEKLNKIKDNSFSNMLLFPLQVANQNRTSFLTKTSLKNSNQIPFSTSTLKNVNSQENELRANHKQNIILYNANIYDSLLFFSLLHKNSLYFNNMDEVLKKYNKNNMAILAYKRWLAPSYFSDLQLKQIFNLNDNYLKQKKLSFSHHNGTNLIIEFFNKKNRVVTYSPDLQSSIWMKWDQKFELGDERDNLLEIRITCFGSRIDIFSKLLYFYDKKNIKKYKYIRTTPGKVIFNSILHQSTKYSFDSIFPNIYKS